MGQAQHDPGESQKENGPRHDDDQPNEGVGRVAVRPREIMTRLPEEACCGCNGEGQDHQEVTAEAPRRRVPDRDEFRIGDWET